MQSFRRVNIAANAQASSPKDQYLFLRALNELFMSLAASPDGSQPLPPNYQSEVRPASITDKCYSQDFLSPCEQLVLEARTDPELPEMC